MGKLESAEEAYRRALRVLAEAGTTSEFDSINVTVTYNLARLLEGATALEAEEKYKALLAEYQPSTPSSASRASSAAAASRKR